MKLNDKTVRGLKLPPDRADQIIFDDEMPGFGVRLRHGGGRTWVVQYRVGRGQRRLTIGGVEKFSADTARKAAKRHLAKVALGGDPQEEKRQKRRQRPFSAVVADYLEVKELAVEQGSMRPRSIVEIRRYLNVHWKSLHHRALGEIRGEDIAARLKGIVKDSGSTAAARARVALSGFFAWAMGEGLATSNPVIAVNAPNEPEARDRVLDKQELTKVWAACRDDDYGRILKLLILTGQRRGEIGGMAWSEIDLEGGLWTLPAARAKNGREHRLPLPDLAISIIETAAHRDERDKLFGWGPNGFAWWSQAKLEFDARFDPPLKPWTVHDLRRSFATGLADLGVAPHVIEATLNHQSGHKRGVAGIYNRSSYGREMRAALALWADHVGTLVEGGERKVVVLRSVP